MRLMEILCGFNVTALTERPASAMFSSFDSSPERCWSTVETVGDFGGKWPSSVSGNGATKEAGRSYHKSLWARPRNSTVKQQRNMWNVLSETDAESHRERRIRMNRYRPHWSTDRNVKLTKYAVALLALYLVPNSSAGHFLLFGADTLQWNHNTRMAPAVKRVQSAGGRRGSGPCTWRRIRYSSTATHRNTRCQDTHTRKAALPTSYPLPLSGHLWPSAVQ